MRPLLALALLLPVAGCDLISDAADNAACRASGYADVGRVSARVAGDAFSAVCVRGDVQAGALVIVGADNVVSDNAQEVITLTYPANELGSYRIGEGATATFTRRSPDPDDQADEVYAATSGTLDLGRTADPADGDVRAQGVFRFTARNAAGDEVTVTDGSFDVTF